jgi:phosphatidylserine/phosphatidylglycerophosphate/cardiolipin synthase-like enzyme
MPRGAATAFAILLIAGAIYLSQEYRSPASAPWDSSPILASHHQYDSEPPAVVSGGIAVYFSPHGGCQAAIVDQIDSAQQTIDMQCYSFTSSEISHALVDAAGRGVRVRVIFDKNAAAERGSQAAYLENHNIPVYIDGQHPIAHNKVIVVDNKTVLTGSFNYTHQAENYNAENLLVLTDKPDLAAAYEGNFEHHLSHSEKAD